MTFKRILVSLCTIFICTMMFISGYVKTSSVCYATDNWQNVTTNDQLVQAFQAYCKSRNLAIEGSILDAVTASTTKAFNNACNTLGIDQTQLQAEIYKKTSGNSGLQWYFTSSGISAYNRIFAEFLQNNNLSVGDSANENDNILQSGEWFSDDDGVGCFVYLLSNDLEVNVVKQGTYYKYNGYDLCNNTPYNTVYNMTFNINNTEYDYDCYWTRSTSINNRTSRINLRRNSPNAVSGDTIVKSSISNSTVVEGYKFPYDNLIRNQFIIYKISTSYYLAYANGYNENAQYISVQYPIEININNTRNTVVYITTNNTVINNNTYEGDTIINDNPSGGGDSGGGDDGGDVPEYDPYPDGGDSTTDPVGSGGVSGDDTDINFPNFNFNLPEIDWSLGDLSEKFPFSIPFDLIAFFTVLNAEPVAPVIDRDIPLGFYTWHFEADFSQFDDYAVIIRNVEFIGFVVGLIYITIRLVKG